MVKDEAETTVLPKTPSDPTPSMQEDSMALFFSDKTEGY